MECKDCAESENGQPAQACCPQCLEEGRAIYDPMINLTIGNPRRNYDLIPGVDGAPGGSCCGQCLDEQRAAMLESGYGVEYSTGKRRYYIDEATALADHLELAGALSLLKDAKTREAKLAAALRVALEAMQEGVVYDSDMETVEAALKEWEGSR
jgi:hypothetical protein